MVNKVAFHSLSLGGNNWKTQHAMIGSSGDVHSRDWFWSYEPSVWILFFCITTYTFKV